MICKNGKLSGRVQRPGHDITTNAFRRAVDTARGREDVRVAVDCVHRRLQDAIELRRPICVSSGRCCRFEEFGHRLFITTMELAVFADALGSNGVPSAAPWDGSGCPFQVKKLCSVHAVRPFGCRIFFCDATAEQWQHEQYELLHATLKREHERLDVAYFYTEWRQALAAVDLPLDHAVGS